MVQRHRFFMTGVLLWMASSGVWAKEEPMPSISSPTVHAIEWSGNSAIASVTLQKRLSIKPDGFYDPGQVAFSRDIVESIYRDKGYADVHVSTSTDSLSSHQIDVHFEVVEGPLYHVGSITVQGNRLISESLIKRDLGLKSGEPFSQTKIYEANKALFLSGYFEAIDIHYSSAPAHVMDIHVSVKERPTRYIKGGFGYGTETKERLSLGYDDRNFFGNEKQLSLSAVHSGFMTNPAKYRTSILESSLAEPHFLGTPLQAQTSVSEEWDDRLPYNSQTTAWRSSLSKKIGDHVTSSLRYRFEGTRITRLDSSQVATTPSFTDVSAMGPSLTFDNTNDPFLPTVGWRMSGLFEKGITLAVGNLAFQRYEAHAGRFDSMKGFTFFEGLQFSLVRPDHPGDTIPIFERYTLGGANTVRGYEQQELGAGDGQGNPLGGNAFAVGNLEVRHALYKKLSGVWFLDGGQLYVQSPGDNWPYIRAKSLGDFAYGTGPGLRLNTPVGAVRLEVGYKLNSGGDNDFLHRTAIDFSLGEVF